MVEPKTIDRAEFIARFKAEMLRVGGETFDEYADETAPTYWDDPGQREEGPEECALADIGYWGE